MGVFFEQTYRVDSRSVDPFDHCRPSALLGLLQEAATDAAELDHSAAAAFGAWAQDAVLALDELDILLEPLTDMDPTAATTRAEAAALMYNFMAYSGILTSVETGEAAEAAA